MLHTDVASWRSHRHSTHDRLMEDTSMGQYILHAKEKRSLYNSALSALAALSASLPLCPLCLWLSGVLAVFYLWIARSRYATEREALRASRNAALQMGRAHDAAALGMWAHGDAAAGTMMAGAIPTAPHAVGSTRVVGPPQAQYSYGTPSPLAAAYAGYDAAFAGADGTRHDPRFVDARHRPSDAEVAYLRRELSDEQRRLLALEEQLAQHKAREGRLARTVDVSLAVWQNGTHCCERL